MLINLIKKLIYLIILNLITCTVHARNGIYFTLDTGIASQTGLPNAANVGAVSTNSAFFPSAYRMGVGYNHDWYDCLGIGLDIGYGYYGKENYIYTANETHVSSRSLEFLFLSQAHIKRWDIVAKLGGIRQTVMVSGQDAQEDQTQIAPEISLGVAYNFTLHFAVMATYAHVFGQQIDDFNNLQNKTPSLNEFLLGIRYSF